MRTDDTLARLLPAEFIAYHARGAPLEGFVSSTIIGPDRRALSKIGFGDLHATNRSFPTSVFRISSTEAVPPITLLDRNGRSMVVAMQK